MSGSTGTTGSINSGEQKVGSGGKGRMLSQSDVIAQLCGAMRAAGLSPSHINLDGEVHRFQVDGDKRRDSGWYVVHANAGDRAFGAFGNWKTSEKHTWVAGGDIRSLSPEERRKLDAAMERDRAARAAKDRAKHDRAAALAVAMWNAATPAPDSHGYLRRKHVRGVGLRVGPWRRWNPVTERQEVIHDECLLVPMFNANGEIRAVQGILPEKLDGCDKFFLPGAQKKGLFFPVGNPVVRNGEPTIVIAEGVATAITLHMTTGHGVVAAFDCGGLLPIAWMMRKTLGRKANIVIAGDDDRFTPGNPGRTKAEEAAKAVRGVAMFPAFDSDDTESTDFNDVFVRKGWSA